MAFGFPLVAALVVYWQTAAAGLTWANGGSDGGDLATALALGGVPHPTGYPLYLLSGQIFRLIETDPARALNLASAMWGGLAAGCTGLVAYRLSKIVVTSVVGDERAQAEFREIIGLAGGWLAGLSLAFAPLMWSQATIDEVYSGEAALGGLLWLTLVGWWQEQGRRAGYTVALVAGLATGYHRTSGLLVLAGLVFVVWRWRQTRRDKDNWPWRAWLVAEVWFFLGLFGPYLYVLVRGGIEPASNWSNPGWSNLAGVWQQFSGEEYRYLLFTMSPAQSLGRFSNAVSLLLGQFGPVGIGLGWVGLAGLGWRADLRPFAGLAGLAVVLPMGFFAVYGADNAEVYLIPALVAWAILMSVGLAGGASWLITEYKRFGRIIVGGAIAVALVWPGVSLVTHWQSLNLADDRTAETWANHQLETAPPKALLLSDTDATTFALWYVAYAQHIRPDLAIVETRLLRFDWYRQNLARLYPDLTTQAAMSSTNTGSLSQTAYLLSVANPNRPIILIKGDKT